MKCATARFTTKTAAPQSCSPSGPRRSWRLGKTPSARQVTGFELAGVDVRRLKASSVERQLVHPSNFRSDEFERYSNCSQYIQDDNRRATLFFHLTPVDEFISDSQRREKWRPNRFS